MLQMDLALLVASRAISVMAQVNNNNNNDNLIFQFWLQIIVIIEKIRHAQLALDWRTSTTVHVLLHALLAISKAQVRKNKETNYPIQLLFFFRIFHSLVTDNNKCLPCDGSCTTCNGTSPTNCLTCSGSLYLQTSTSKCISDCGIRFYKNKDP